jgi:signal transduction histidine kinase
VCRGLRPLQDVAAQIRRLDATDLSARVSVAAAPLEIRPVADRLNELLTRLEEAFQRERSSSADVAHELRTPLAGIRSAAEVALGRERSGSEYREALEDILHVTTGVQDMVEKLLAMARIEASEVEVSPEEVDFNDLVAACWEPFAAIAEARALQLNWLTGPEASSRADRPLLELAVRNVMQNAVRYADKGGTVTIEIATSEDRVSLRVANTGSLVAEADAELVFQRFWRGDAARTEAGVRSGLGLSLVKKIMEVLGGEARVASHEGGQFVAWLSLPRAVN